MAAAGIVQLTIKRDNVEPVVIRWLKALPMIRLEFGLQTALGQIAIDLFEFWAMDASWRELDPDFSDGPPDASKAGVVDVLEYLGLRSIKYRYDFGDGRRRSVRIDRVTKLEPGAVRRCLITATGFCPPEDISGPYGYGEFLPTIVDSNREPNAEFMEWDGAIFDPNAVDVERHARSAAALA